MVIFIVVRVLTSLVTIDLLLFVHLLLLLLQHCLMHSLHLSRVDFVTIVAFFALITLVLLRAGGNLVSVLFQQESN